MNAPRRRQEAGDTASMVRLLLERRRAGEVKQEQLYLAAFAGHEAAKEKRGGFRQLPLF